MGEVTTESLAADVAAGRRCAHCQSEWHGSSRPVETPRGKMHVTCATLFRSVWRFRDGRWEAR